MTAPARFAMGVEEGHEFEEWRERRAPYRDGSSIHEAFLTGYRNPEGENPYRDGSVQHNAFLDGQRAYRRVEAAPKVHVQCSDCAWDGEHRVIADRGHELEVRCPLCGESTYERVAD